MVEQARRTDPRPSGPPWFASVCLSVMLSTACGGGSDTPADPVPRTPQAAQASVNAKSEAPPARPRGRPFDREGITALAVAPHGNGIGVAQSDGSVRLLDPTGTRVLREFAIPGSAVAVGVSFTGNGRYLVAVGRDSVARAWNVATGKPLFTMQGHEHALRAVSASTDGAMLATSAEETRILLWNGASGRLEKILNHHTDFVNALGFSVDGRLLASGGADARVLVWEVATGRLLHTLRGHASEVNAVAFASTGVLASAGNDGRVLLWDAVEGRQLPAIPGHGAALESIAFTSDGAWLAAGAHDGKVLAWDVAPRAAAQALVDSGPAVNAVAFDTVVKSRLFAGNAANQVVALELPPTGKR